MTASFLLLGVVLATLARTQTLLEGPRGYSLSQVLGNFFLLMLPLAAIYVTPELGEKWRHHLFHASFTLSIVLLVARVPRWESCWPLVLAWPMLPLIYTADHLGVWLAMITVEFLLLLSYFEIDPASDYHKYGLLRLVVIFQFFVFEHLFLQARPDWAGEILTGLLLLLYLAGLWRTVRSLLRRKTLLSWLFLLVYLQYGLMVFDKIIGDKLKT